LSRFKTERCKNLTNGKQHNHKHCRYFHTIKDRRRLLEFDNLAAVVAKSAPGELWRAVMQLTYQPDLCQFQETEQCPRQDECPVSHNRVESVYHQEKYKSKYCTKYPKNLHKCDYGDYCSFAHNTKELKTRLIHQMARDPDFYMFYFKTEWCPYNREHNKAQCVYAHNWQDFRRKPNIFRYDSAQTCRLWKPGTFIAKYHEGCLRQASCPHSHGWKEQEYHPLFYKTRRCEELHTQLHRGRPSPKCQRGVECPYFHTEAERREPELVAQRRNRPDFQYDKILELSMNLNNINQLQELILIKVCETQTQPRDLPRPHYLEIDLLPEHKRALVSKGVFRDITLYFMISRKVLTEEHFQKKPLTKDKDRKRPRKEEDPFLKPIEAPLLHSSSAQPQHPEPPQSQADVTFNLTQSE